MTASQGWPQGRGSNADEVNNTSGTGEKLQDIISRRFSRRSFLIGVAAGVPLVIAGQKLGTDLLIARPVEAGATIQTALGPAASSDVAGFEPIHLSNADRIEVAWGYDASVLIKWGDPITSLGRPFNLLEQSPEAQRQQFGYNADFIGFFPLGDRQSGQSDWGLLTVNHEYTNPELMFPDYDADTPTLEQVDIELAAHGMSVVEVRLQGLGWRYHQSSRFNRRITGETPMLLTGPAAGHDWLKTSADRIGKNVRGTLNNCAGGKTPWGTVLTAEENFNQYFGNAGALDDSDPRKLVHQRYGIPEGESERKWERFHHRFDVSREPNEPFRFGWLVEIDPYDPNFIPRKLTALGRTKHEAGTVALGRDGQAVVYSGDDQRFDYMYKFVSANRYNPDDRAANFGLLDTGTLYVAKFNDDGSGEWLPLVQGRGPLTSDNGFASQGDVLINTRSAGDVVGATQMDRPEDIEMNPVNGRVYCLMTNNTDRGTSGNPGPDAANPRSDNQHGHIIELTEEGDDPAATRFSWEIFMLCGDPQNPDDDTFFGGADPSEVSPISSPDNVVFDNLGNLWISTDGQINRFERNDGIYMVPVEGPYRGAARQFFSGVRGAEVCGPEFTPNNETLFCAIQHPGEGGTLTDSVSSWPDSSQPPKPSVVAITKTSPGSKVIGS
jgi:secreted PhoX family phosphatase